jgi:hypothetical protein
MEQELTATGIRRHTSTIVLVLLAGFALAVLVGISWLIVALFHFMAVRF